MPISWEAEPAYPGFGSEWHARTRPFAAALVADEDDETARLVAADFVDEYGDVYFSEKDRVRFRELAGGKYGTPTDPHRVRVQKSEARTDALLRFLGDRRLCPACRPPLHPFPCRVCHGRRHVSRNDMGEGYSAAIVGAAAAEGFAVGWQGWTIGVIFTRVTSDRNEYLYYSRPVGECVLDRVTNEGGVACFRHGDGVTAGPASLTLYQDASGPTDVSSMNRAFNNLTDVYLSAPDGQTVGRERGLSLRTGGEWWRGTPRPALAFHGIPYGVWDEPPTTRAMI